MKHVQLVIENVLTGDRTAVIGLFPLEANENDFTEHVERNYPDWEVRQGHRVWWNRTEDQWTC
jgi:hypothetical protein